MIRFSCSLNLPSSEWGLDPIHINTYKLCVAYKNMAESTSVLCTSIPCIIQRVPVTGPERQDSRLAWCSRWHLFLPTQATCEIKAAHTQSHITLSSLHEYVTLYPSVFHSSVRCQVAAAIQTVLTAEEMRWQAKIMEWEEKYMCVLPGFSDIDVNLWPKFCYLLFIH